MKLLLGSSITDAANPKLRRGEYQQLMKAWNRGSQRSKAFHTFCASEEIKRRIPGLLETRFKLRQVEAANKNTPFVHENRLSALHQVKAQLWGELSVEQKENWKNKASEIAAEDVENQDRYAVIHPASLHVLRG